MSGLFGGGGGSVEVQKQEVVPVADKSTSEVTNLADQQRKRIYGASAGRANAMLTGGLGASTSSAGKAVRSLGGSGGY